MNAYDFDGTLRYGDSTLDFYFWCLGRYPAMLLDVPNLVVSALGYAAKKLTKTQFKQEMYRFLRRIPDVKGEVRRFWVSGKKKLMRWYTPRKGDVVISASPEFLLEPICEELGVELLASRVDAKSGVYDGLNCHGGEKVRRFREVYPDAVVEEFCTDSLSDEPMAALAKKAYMIRGGKKHLWKRNGKNVTEKAG